MRNDNDEFVPGDPQVGKSWLIIFFLYVLLLVWLEPLIDFLLTMNPPDKELGAIQAFNEQKAYIAGIAFGIARSLPILLFMWVAYRVMLSGRIPPKGMKVPFTVKLIKGQTARMAGMSMIALSLLLLLREMYLMVNV
ncbi:MAG: hypothetical protein PVG89_17460 [Gammaproteobacteria bacterium]|jgi:hypothetical protein